MHNDLVECVSYLDGPNKTRVANVTFHVNGSEKSFAKPPDLELPQIPGGSEMPYYSELPEQENGKLRKKEIHWHKFVKQALEVPEATNLTIVEGIGVYEELHEPSITYNGQSYETISINANDSVTLICSGGDSTPKLNLTWRINRRSPHGSNFKVTPSLGLSSLIFQPEHNDLVECVSYLDGPNKTRVANVTFHVREKHTEEHIEPSVQFNYFLNVIVPLVVATVTIFLVICVYSATKRLKGSQSADFSASLQLALRDRPVNGVSNVSRDLPSIRHSMVIPTDEESVEINCGEDKSSTVTNVELGVHLPGEGTFQYWTANASFNNENSKKVIAKCVSDSVQMKEHMNFRTLAENLKSIKTHRNIIEILGVSITSVPYYIYMEYLEYGTLRDFLMRNYQQSRDSQSNVAQTLDEKAIHLTGFALDVADGLIYLTDRDYHHPALCARKILLTKSGICKLYDFWPKSLSTERINQILQKSHPPVAWLSPETIFMRQYSEKSDVWNFGVVLWEIYSLGEIPYSGLTCEEIEQEIRKMHYLDQPLTCPGGIFSMMLASWDTTVDDRPDLSEWKQKLVCLLQSARQDIDDKNGTDGTGEQSYFTLESDICDYEDDYIEQ
ncbi:Tyrosine kinase receptor Cad96Ca [Holothuria leucospilota]|uniref:Tyrosine kinase receptor Cad96Ca n=1 Tax=Holothuria leucospilota TaxID=206669 RepID=A0A9Q0YQ04_HOLLE|nr:Tyrosine kinase receptor Cad96Ca [Holothuria leucospilota]